MNIAITCPQCGAEVDLAEEDTVFRCLYCGSTLKPTGRNEVQSFFIGPRETAQKVGKALLRALQVKGQKGLRIAEHYLLYVPYWRVIGMIFQWTFARKYLKTPSGDRTWEDLKKLRATPWVHTFPAFDSSQWGLSSLGLRVQVLKIWPFHKEKMGTGSLLVEQTISFDAAVDHAHKSITKQGSHGSLRIDMAYSELIGERYSLLYFPFYCYTLGNDGRKSLLIVDALSHKVIKGHVDVDRLKGNATEDKIPYKPLNFIPFACPNCGWDLTFRPHTMIHFCKSCAQAWEERGGGYVPVPYRVAFKENLPGMTFKYLPFWHLTVNIATPEKTYHTAKDFYELFPVPKVWDPNVLKDKTISFYIPAFKIRNAVLVDKFASQLTKAQPTFAESEPDSIEDLDLSDVWLRLNEAKEMAHVLLYSMTWEHHKRTRKVVKNATLKFPEATLLCLPFMDKGIYLREAETDFALQKNALEID